MWDPTGVDTSCATAGGSSRPASVVAGAQRLSGESALGTGCVQFDGPPAVPGDDRAVGAIRVAERFELARGRHRHLPCEAVALADTEVACRPDIEPPQPEDEEHLRRPRSDPANGREAGDYLFIRMEG